MLNGPITDRKILREIYDRYLSEFKGYDRSKPARADVNYVPIDVEAVGRSIGSTGDLVFGRLFFHMDQKYGYVSSRGHYIHLFAKAVAGDTNCINFPLLAAVLAELEDRTRQFWIATTIAIISLVIAGISILVALSTN